MPRAPMIVFGLLAAGAAGAAEITREVEVDAKAAEVWAEIGPFCAIGDWYPGIESCTLEEVDGAPHRRLVVAGGDARFLEKEGDGDGSAMSYGYDIMEGPLPVENYSATFTVRDNGDKATIVWSSSFDPKGVSEDEALEVLGGVYDTGLDALKERFSR